MTMSHFRDLKNVCWITAFQQSVEVAEVTIRSGRTIAGSVMYKVTLESFAQGAMVPLAQVLLPNAAEWSLPAKAAAGLTFEMLPTVPWGIEIRLTTDTDRWVVKLDVESEENSGV